jgi:hypothetical protein
VQNTNGSTIVVGEKRTILGSNDGIHWNPMTIYDESGVADQFLSVTWNPDLHQFVAVGVTKQLKAIVALSTDGRIGIHP